MRKKRETEAVPHRPAEPDKGQYGGLKGLGPGGGRDIGEAAETEDIDPEGKPKPRPGLRGGRSRPPRPGT
jgi:hypothetical protein